MGAADEPARMGYRILSVDPGSPMSALRIAPMLDFIVYPDLVEQDVIPFEEYLSLSENKQISLTLYNIITRSSRQAKIVPRKWDGPGLLGATIRLEDYAVAHERVMRVLNIYMDSPLHRAGLHPMKDYILGTDGASFKSPEEFSEFVQRHNRISFDVYVYNSEENVVRKATLRPDDQWGGKGTLGGDIGFGENNFLPSVIAEESKIKTRAADIAGSDRMKLDSEVPTEKKEEGEEEKKEAAKSEEPPKRTVPAQSGKE